VTSATRVSVIGVLLIGVLSLPLPVSAQQRPPIADEIAKAYGFDSWSKVDAVRYTFTLDAGPKFKLHRTWTWEPKTDQITYEGPGKDGKPLKITYKRSDLANQDAFVKEMVDPAFFNDQYWLVFPFHMIWDTAATITDGGKKKLPIGKGSARNVVVQYPSGGGYLPGDTWSLFVGPDNRIQQLAFKHGGTAKPGVVTATWEKYKKAGPILFSTFHRGKADAQPFTLTLSKIAVKMAGADTWVEAK
jgi:hypothetical protein